jgi:hypothetical protein
MERNCPFCILFLTADLTENIQQSYELDSFLLAAGETATGVKVMCNVSVWHFEYPFLMLLLLSENPSVL